MTKRKPIAGTAAMTKLEQKAFAFLLQHRFYNRQDSRPTVLVGQWEICEALKASQPNVSNALAQLRKRGYIEKTGTPRPGETQLYTINHPAHLKERDLEERRKLTDDRPAGEHQLARLRAAKAERFATRGRIYNTRPPRILREGPDDNQTEAEAEATAAEMLRDNPELEGPWEALEGPKSA